MISREAITFNGKYVVLLNREVSSAAGKKTRGEPDLSSAYEDITEEYLVAGNHPEWRIGSDLSISLPGEKIRGRVTAVVVDRESSKTKVCIHYRKIVANKL